MQYQMTQTAFASTQEEIVKLAQLDFSRKIKLALRLAHFARHIMLQLDIVYLVIQVIIFSMEPAQLGSTPILILTAG